MNGISSTVALPPCCGATICGRHIGHMSVWEIYHIAVRRAACAAIRLAVGHAILENK